MYDGIMSDSLKVVIDFMNEKAPQGFIPIGPVASCTLDVQIPVAPGEVVDAHSEPEFETRTFFYVVIAKVAGRIVH